MFVCLRLSALIKLDGFAQGKCTDVRKLVLEQKSQNYLRWNELLGGGRKVNVEGDRAGIIFHFCDRAGIIFHFCDLPPAPEENVG